MRKYLDQLVCTSKTKLRENNIDDNAYRNLIESTYCNLLLFNKRRVGELQRITLDTYIKHQDNKPQGDFEKLLSPSEKILIKSLKRIVVKGKRGRGVPVLVDKITQSGIDLSIELRNNFYPSHNPYLFGLPGQETCISGYHVFRKHVGLALGDPLKTRTLTSTKLRKHLATISQILKMDNDDLEQLATFMGHTTKTHNEWYRLPSDVYQTAKVSKILLLAQNNSIDQYKGRSLNELEIGDELMETQESENETDEMEPVEVDYFEEKKTKTENSTTCKRRKITRKAWKKEERTAAEKYFKTNIKNKIPPKKAQVLKFMEANPELFKDREWQTIKAYICNQYKRK